jgi:serine/threonine protein kinase, bacterial
MRLIALGALLVTVVGSASAAAPVRVALAARPSAPVAGRALTLRLTVRPASYAGAVRVTATGPGRLSARATRKRGAYQARLVFPAAGRWTLTARAGSSSSRLGSIQVRPAARQPIAFTEPTSIELEPSGTLLLVENNPGRVLRVDPASGAVTVLVPSVDRPYAIVRAASGALYVSVGNSVRRLEANGTLTTVAETANGVGPLAAAPNGDVFFTTPTQLFRLAGGAGPATLVTDTQFAAPHGLAAAGDGTLLVSDTDNNRILRVDPATGAVSLFAEVGNPRGIDVAADGTVYVIAARDLRLLHLGAAGTLIGPFGRTFDDPYDVELASDGGAYLLDVGHTGFVRRIAADGTVTTVSHS